MLLLAGLALAVSSCGSSGPKLYPVKGKVLFQGQPPEGAVVVLRPVSQKAPVDIFPRGAVKADGGFTLECYNLGAGAPPGEYVAILTWYPPDAREQQNPVSKLPAKYADETTSGLLVTVKPERNELATWQLTN